MRVEHEVKNINILSLLTAVDLSTATITSSAILIDQCTGYSVSIAVTGSPVGVWKLQGSNSALDAGSVPSASWDDVSGAAYTTSTAEQWTWNVTQVFYRYVRLVWTKTSGTGTITVANYTAKA